MRAVIIRKARAAQPVRAALEVVPMLIASSTKIDA
jgi:hypothetical protein